MKKNLKLLAKVLMAGILLGFAGCKTEPQYTVAVEKLEITAEQTELVEDSTISLTAKVSPDDASDKTVTWSSSDSKIATVDPSTGKVTGISAGTAKITATAGDKTATVEITVNAKFVAVENVTITSASSVNVGEEIT